MKIFSLLLILGFCQYDLVAQKAICGNDLIFHKSSLPFQNSFDSCIAHYISIKNTQNRAEITIPIVVHIVWKNIKENISDESVISQINALNRDYNAENDDIKNVPNEFKSIVGNIGIHFCLAANDSKGNPTTSIIRIQTNKDEIGLSDDLYSTEKGGSDAWNINQYLNIWVANTGNYVSGLGSYPNQPQSEKTGIVIHPKYFGTNTSLKYGFGRVATHEIGHYLGLKHLWGDNSDCGIGDEVADTPSQKQAYKNCPSYPQKNCSDSEMFMNFMDYVDDPCMIMFTKGQKERMLATIMLFRNGLLDNNTTCLVSEQTDESLLSIYPNPSDGFFDCSFISIAPMGIVYYEIYDSTGKLIKRENKLVNQTFSLDLYDLPKGLYFLKMKTKIYKLIKT